MAELLDSEPSYTKVREKVHRMIDEMCGRVLAESSPTPVLSTPDSPNPDEPESAVDQLASLYALVTSEPKVQSSFLQYRHLRSILAAYPELVTEEVQMLRAWNDEQKKKILELECSLRQRDLGLQAKDKTIARLKAELQGHLNQQRRLISDLSRTPAVRPHSAATRLPAIRPRSAATPSASLGELIELRKKVEALETDNVQLRRRITSRPSTPGRPPGPAAPAGVPVSAVQGAATVAGVAVTKEILAIQEIPLLQRKVAKLDANLSETTARTRQLEREIFSKDMQLRDARMLTTKLTQELDSVRREVFETKTQISQIIKARTITHVNHI